MKTTKLCWSNSQPLAISLSKKLVLLKIYRLKIPEMFTMGKGMEKK